MCWSKLFTNWQVITYEPTFLSFQLTRLNADYNQPRSTAATFIIVSTKPELISDVTLIFNFAAKPLSFFTTLKTCRCSFAIEFSYTFLRLKIVIGITTTVCGAANKVTCGVVGIMQSHIYVVFFTCFGTLLQILHTRVA